MVTEPAVAEIRTVLLTASGVLGELSEHPMMEVDRSTPLKSANDHLCRFPAALRRRAKPNMVMGSNKQLRTLRAEIDSLAAIVVLVMASRVVATPPPVNIVWEGLKSHENPAAKPVHANVTVPASPASEVTCRLMGDEATPEEICTLLVDDDRVMFGASA